MTSPNPPLVTNMQRYDIVDNREYVLPVPMTELQKKVSSAIISSNFSEILSFFDPKAPSHDQYQNKLEQMMFDLSTVATHPLLLLHNFLPNLASRRAPSTVENVSGKFQVLVQLCKQFIKESQNVAIMCPAGLTTDLVELLLFDRGFFVTRYSSSNTKLYRKEQSKRKGAHFHLLPNDLRDLRMAVYAPFDAMILLDNGVDLTGNYGRGLRMQLRDPNQRYPYATVIRLVPRNTAQHVELDPSLSFEQKIASVVVSRKDFGQLPAYAKYAYRTNFESMQRFFMNPDMGCKIPVLPRVKEACSKDVELSLYLDDEDQYQVNYTDRSALRAKQTTDSDSESMEEEVKDELAEETPKIQSSLKRRRVELEPRAIQVCQSLSSEHPLSTILLLQYNDMLQKTRLAEEEVEDHRLQAANRESEIQKLRDDNGSLVNKSREDAHQLEKTNVRMDRMKVKLDQLQKELEESQTWRFNLDSELKPLSDKDQIANLTQKLDTSERECQRVKALLESEKGRFDLVKSTADASAEYASNLSMENKNLVEELNVLKSKQQKGPSVRELALREQVKEQARHIFELDTELANLKRNPNRGLNPPRAKGRPAKSATRGRGRPPGSGTARQLHAQQNSEAS